MCERDSNLYGTTSGGGSLGTVFEPAPPAARMTAWTETVLHAFTGRPDGGGPRGGLIAAKNGTRYGTTLRGGAHSGGTVFDL